MKCEQQFSFLLAWFGSWFWLLSFPFRPMICLSLLDFALFISQIALWHPKNTNIYSLAVNCHLLSTTLNCFWKWASVNCRWKYFECQKL